jgi:hypothetical protein
MNPSLRTVYATIPAAFVLWFFIFALPVGNFWLKLTGSASLLAAIGLVSSRNELKALFVFKVRHLWVGALSALILYGIFWVGKLAANLLFQREKNLIPLIISHALWDFLIFVLFPMK